MYKYNNKDDDKELYGQQPEQPADGGTNDGDNVQTDEAQQQQPQQQRKFSTYDDILSYMADKGVSDEDRKKLEKRNRINSIVAGIADAGSALSNLIATTRYAPNAYDHKQGMSAKAQERYDKAMADFDKNRAWHLNYAMHAANAKAADEDRANRLLLAQQQQAERQRLAEQQREEKERKAREKELADFADDWANEHGYNTRAANGELNPKDEIKNIDDAVSKELIDADQAKAVKRKLHAINDKAGATSAQYTKKKETDSKYRTSGGGVGGRYGNYYEYIAGYQINKNDHNSAVNEGYQAIPERFKSRRARTLNEQHKAIVEFLDNPNISEEYKRPVRNKLESISQRKKVVATAPAQQPKKKTENGKESNGSLLPKKQNNNGGGSLLPQKK